jgi:hypothetical protein
VRTKPAAVFPVFRSAAQTAILSELYLHEGGKTAAALSRAAGITVRAVLKWLPELEAGGVIWPTAATPGCATRPTSTRRSTRRCALCWK